MLLAYGITVNVILDVTVRTVVDNTKERLLRIKGQVSSSGVLQVVYTTGYRYRYRVQCTVQYTELC